MLYTKVISVKDFDDPALHEAISAIYPAYLAWDIEAPYPLLGKHRKLWELGMAFLTLYKQVAKLGAQDVLGVGAGFEPLIYYLLRYAKSVHATDKYADAGVWADYAPFEMLTNPAMFAPDNIYDAHELRRLVVQHMDGRELRYPDKTFGGIFSNGSIEHFGSLDDIAQAATEMGRVLKPKGVLSLSTELALPELRDGPRYDGNTWFLTVDEIQRYIIEPSGLTLIGDLGDLVIDVETADTIQSHQQAIVGGPHTFPHIVMQHGSGCAFTSVHLALKKE